MIGLFYNRSKIGEIENSRVLRHSAFKYIANVVPLEYGQQPAWKPHFDFELKDIRD